MPVVTAFYATLTALMCVVLSARVIHQRRRKRISIGDGGDPDMSRAARVFGNFTEYAALVIVLLALAEMLGTPRLWLHVYGTAFMIGRIAHAIGLSLTLAPNIGRLAGMVTTFTVLVALAVSLLAIALPKLD